MSNRLFLTFHDERTNEEVDLELPGNQTLNELLPYLIKVLYWPNPDSDNPPHYSVQTDDGIVIDKSLKLLEQGIQNSDDLYISVDEAVIGTAVPDTEEAAFSDDNTAVMAPSPADRRGYFQPKQPFEIPISKPSLVSEKGLVFVLGDPPVLIGRKAMGTEPAIDLAEIDYENISSKKHAEIYSEDDKYYLHALKTTNGTFVNGTEIDPGSKRILEDKDVIQFGFSKGVKLTFRLPNT